MQLEGLRSNWDHGFLLFTNIPIDREREAGIAGNHMMQNTDKVFLGGPPPPYTYKPHIDLTTNPTKAVHPLPWCHYWWLMGTWPWSLGLTEQGTACHGWSLDQLRMGSLLPLVHIRGKSGPVLTWQQGSCQQRYMSSPSLWLHMRPMKMEDKVWAW